MEQQQTAKRNWEILILESDTTVARELLRTYEEGNMQELSEALRIHYENSVRGAEYELLVHLKELMENIILAKLSDEFRTQERWEKIVRLRSEIEEDKEYNDCITDDTINENWNSALDWAKDLAEVYIPEAIDLNELSWNDLLTENYFPTENGN